MYKFVSHVRMESAISIRKINMIIYELDSTIKMFKVIKKNVHLLNNFGEATSCMHLDK